jgi:hypothetical protein
LALHEFPPGSPRCSCNSRTEAAPSSQSFASTAYSNSSAGSKNDVKSTYYDACRRYANTIMPTKPAREFREVTAATFKPAECRTVDDRIVL